MRNEGPFALDWIVHLKVVGVDEVLVFTNDCDDGTDGILDALLPLGVTHLPNDGGGKAVQWRALQAARRHPAYARADWVLAIDCDEFPVPKPPFDTLKALIAEAQADAIVLPWRLFGSAGLLRFEDRPVPERFTRAAPERVLFPAAARFFKTLYRRAAFARPGIHRPKARNGPAPRWVDGGGRVLDTRFAKDDRAILLPEPEVAYGTVQLNHYSLRSAEDFLVKRRRGLPNRDRKPIDASYWAERNFNTVEDLSADRFRAPSAALRSKALALPGVAEAQAHAVAAHRARIAELLRDADAARLFTRLALLPGSVSPDDETAVALLRLMTKTEA